MQQAIIRLVVLLILLVNQFLIVFGWNPLPFSEEEIYQGVSAVVTFVVTIYTWWKNNSITKEAREGDRVMKQLKERNKQIR